MSQIPESGPIVKILVSTNPRHPERGLNVLNTGIVAEGGAKDVQAVLPHWAVFSSQFDYFLLRSSSVARLGAN